MTMHNIFKDFKVSLRFDLKGSIANRTVLNPTQKPSDIENIALKDNDFRQHIGHLTICDTSDKPDAMQ